MSWRERPVEALVTDLRPGIPGRRQWRAPFRLIVCFVGNVATATVVCLVLHGLGLV
jgi:hypothetical protein